MSVIGIVEPKVEDDLSRESEKSYQVRDFRWRMLKAFLILGAFGATYGALLVFDLPIYVAIVATIALAVLNYAIVACIGHDAVHGVFSRFRPVNEVALLALDFSGVNGLLWRGRHMDHHRETNDIVRDPDIRGMPWMRMTPYDRWMPHHRLQAIYIPLIYALTILKVQVFDEVGFIRNAPARKRTALLARSIMGKAVFVTWSMVIPILVHGAGAIPFVILGYCTLSMIVSVIFQVAHNVPGVTHVHTSLAGTGRENWLRHQIGATTNFRVGPLMDFFVGGLDRQIEHHLFPHLPHTQLVTKEAATKEICAKLTVEYKNERSLAGAFWSHLRYLHLLGRNREVASLPV